LARLAARLGLAQARAITELEDRIQGLERQQSGQGGGIRELQEWNHNLTRQIAELSDWVARVERRAAPLETDRGLFLAIARLRRAHAAVEAGPAPADPASELTPWELRAYSQHGEDGVLAEILRRVGAPSRSFVEFGAETGTEGNCVFLADVARWSGLFIEGASESFDELAAKYQSRDGVTTLQALVTPQNVEELFARGGVPREPDVLSIDVDGADYWIWEAITGYAPRVVVIEYNALLDPNRRLVQPRDVEGWDGTDYYGASIAAVRALAESKGYRLVHAEQGGINAFLVRGDLADERFPSAEQVPVRRPNYFLVGYRHPVDPHGRRYLDLDTGELVDGRRGDSASPSGGG
jgi:hypothetical protein